MTCTDAGNADIAWSNIYAPAADGLEQWVSFSFILLVRTVTPFFRDDVIQWNIPALAV